MPRGLGVWCQASRADPVAVEGIPERFMPERRFRGREKRKLAFALRAAAAPRGGAEPDLLDGAAWRQADGFWQYALFATVA